MKIKLVKGVRKHSQWAKLFSYDQMEIKILIFVCNKNSFLWHGRSVVVMSLLKNLATAHCDELCFKIPLALNQFFIRVGPLLTWVRDRAMYRSMF